MLVGKFRSWLCIKREGPRTYCCAAEDAYVIACDAGVAVLAAVFVPSKANGVSFLQMSNRRAYLLNHPNNLHRGKRVRLSVCSNEAIACFNQQQLQHRQQQQQAVRKVGSELPRAQAQWGTLSDPTRIGGRERRNGRDHCE